jgi:hypothetical protein
MQLRAHPCMTHRGVSNWPPLWTCISGQGNPPDDETSSLEEVHRSTVVKNECFLIIQCDETRYMGALQFDDEQCCEKICTLLSDHCGQSVRDIGELDVP